jgi:hypothetical protein
MREDAGVLGRGGWDREMCGQELIGWVWSMRRSRRLY